jgi:hypothetical protein
MLEIVYTRQQPLYFFNAENNGQLPSSGTRWKAKAVFNFPLTDMPVKESDSCQVIFA